MEATKYTIGKIEIKFRAWNGSEMRYDVNVNQGKPVRRGYQWFSVDNDVHDSDLMQFIGLKDKNGEDAYSGDIVTDGINHPFVIDLWEFALMHRLSEIEFKIIGNVFENPDSLFI